MVCINTANGYKALGGHAPRIAAAFRERRETVDTARKTFRKTLSLVPSAVTEQDHKDIHGLSNQAFAALTVAENALIGVR